MCDSLVMFRVFSGAFYVVVVVVVVVVVDSSPHQSPRFLCDLSVTDVTPPARTGQLSGL